jgi:hypothetical protein
MPIYKSDEAKTGGWQQVRTAMQRFEMDVVGTEDGQWGGTTLGEDGKPLPPKEYFEVHGNNMHVLNSTEPLEMDVEGKEFSFRVNTSESKNSFWVDNFLASADKNKILLPDGIVGKRVVWIKQSKEWDISGKKIAYTNYVIESVRDSVVTAPPIQQVVQTQTAPAPTTPTSVTPPIVSVTEDPMQIALELAVGKTEAQFRSTVSMHPSFINSPLLPLAKAGAITSMLVSEGKLKLVSDGTKQFYAKP